MNSSVSVIIPTLNEEPNLEVCINALGSMRDFELIVVDGGSRDDTVTIAKKMDAQVFTTSPCRASQMNLGARMASGEILVFLHADTLLPDNWIQIVRKTLVPPNVILGAFEFSLDELRWQFLLIRKLANFRSRFFQMPYGDQALFVGRDNFYRIGGFPEIMIMEDFAFCRLAKRHGLIKTVSAQAITSCRRWKNRGIIRNTLINQYIIALFALGASDRKLRSIYDAIK
ncbi:MAG: TIGR04283 family arsenosugar biosynthesis glycosyltransferase [Syntrophaceae bacterium]|nr:TIGR04283 family arsenosugar biosynthesis glycosyltransferase [Syntrophaceae bacterium]